MNRYRLQIKDIEKYARAFWDNLNGKVNECTASYIQYMTNDCAELHYNVCDAFVISNHWHSNCSIPKEDFAILEIDSHDNIVVKEYTYEKAWAGLDKKNVSYRSDVSGVTKSNIFRLLEPLTDVKTGEVVCMTSYFNLLYMMHLDLHDNFEECNFTEFKFESPVYLLSRANKKGAGALNKYFDEE